MKNNNFTSPLRNIKIEGVNSFNSLFSLPFIAYLVAILLFLGCGKNETPTVAKSITKTITSFVFKATDNDALTTDVTATVTGTTITAPVPFGTNVKALKPTIVVADKATVSPHTGVVGNFTNDVTYTVTAEDGTTQDYTVKVTPAPSPAKAITSFIFTTADNDALTTDDVIAMVTGTTITATVPFGTDVKTLKPTIAVHDKASIAPASKAVQDFTQPVKYTVTAADGTTQDYTVTVTPAPSPTKAISSFVFTTADNTALTTDLTATVIGTDINIVVSTDTDITTLKPTIVHDGASIAPASEAVQDFSKPVSYTVTAADGTTQAYTIRVRVTIPDDNFRAYLKSEFAAAFNDQDKMEIHHASVTGFNGGINVSGKKIVDLTGVEYFKNLTVLNCSDNELTMLDLSENIALTQLICLTNKLTELNLSENAALAYLDCSKNELTMLDLSKNPALTQLNCLANKLKMLDLRNTSGGMLQIADVDDNNPLEKLLVNERLKNNEEIKKVKNTRNKDVLISTYDNGTLVCNNYDSISEICTGLLTELTLTIDGKSSPITFDNDKKATVTLPYQMATATIVTMITVASIATVPNTKASVAKGDQLSPSNGKATITVTDNTDASIKDSYEITVEVGEKLALTSFKFEATDNKALNADITARISPDAIITIVVPAGTDMTALTPTIVNEGMSIDPADGVAQDFNNLITYTVTLQDNTKQVYMIDIRVTIPNLFFGALLKSLFIKAFNDSGMDINHAEVTGFSGQIDTGMFRINSLVGIQYFKRLTGLSCNNGRNELTTLDLSENTALLNLDCSKNQLTTLDLSKNSALQSLNCSENQLTTLDIRGMTGGSLIINAGVDGKNPLEKLLVNEAVKDNDEIKEVKTNRGKDVVISTYKTDGTVVCADYDPDKDTCTTTP